jgi:KDO2-lipid IV(A) lauroyltransferase
MNKSPVEALDWPEKVQALKSQSVKSWCLVTLFQSLAKMPHRGRQVLGRFLGAMSPILVPRRAHIVSCNLALCFPEKSALERKKMLRAHFRVLAQTFVDRGVLWFGTAAQLRELVTVSGLEKIHLYTDSNRPLMLLAPHFVALDAAASRLTLAGPQGATIYTPQSDPDVDALVRLGRGRFHKVHLISKKDGVRGLIRLIRQGVPTYYLPDMDFGIKGGVFVPFFGVPAATQTATAQLVRQFDLPVIPILSAWDPKTGRYHITIGDEINLFESADTSLESATARLNELLEGWIREHPTQYYWVHRRFKTRPEGEASPYDK